MKIILEESDIEVGNIIHTIEGYNYLISKMKNIDSDDRSNLYMLTELNTGITYLVTFSKKDILDFLSRYGILHSHKFKYIP